MTQQLTLCPARALRGAVDIPGDKSISHRAIMFGSLAKGDTKITHFLESADCLATMDCFERLGVRIEQDPSSLGELVVHGVGLHGLKPGPAAGSTAHRHMDNAQGSIPSAAPVDEPDSCPAGDTPVRLYSANSGTTTRILSGILAPQDFTAILSGDESVNCRPMKRVIEPLSEMGADIVSVNGNGCAPLRITGKALHGITYRTKIASAQVKSAILCAGLYADGKTTVIEPAISRDHTERMLAAFSHAPAVTDLYDAGGAYAGHAVTITTAKELLSPGEIVVPGDISSAAYFIAAACITPDSEVLIRNVGMNETRGGILRAARAMGADITVAGRVDAAEPYADLLVKTSSLHGTTIEGSIIPALIDELPVIAVMAAAAEGTTVIRDAAELKVKESDRIATVTEGLRAMGARVTPTEDGMIIEGGRPLHGALIHTYKDHRVAMSFAVASLIAEGETILDDSACVNISYPEFFRDLQSLRK